MHVAGAAGVTILNTSDARISYVQKLPVIENINLSYLEEGDSYDFTTGIITPADGMESIKGKEHHSDHYSGQEGILSPDPAAFRDLITVYLADNKGNDTLKNITLINPSSGFQVSLWKTPESDGFYPGKLSHGERFTVTHIRMDIVPVQVSVTPLK